MVYSWTVTGLANSREFYYHHGELVPHPNNKETSYRKRLGKISESGSLHAPFSGIHGRYFQNQSERPAVVHFRLAGSYRLTPKGEDGDEAGIEPLRQGNPK
jgi:hypothetical protein